MYNKKIINRKESINIELINISIRLIIRDKMDNKKILENIFNKNGIKWDIKDFDNYIDPGCKTPSSIYSKLIRLYSDFNSPKDYTILNSGIKDLLRMTTIVDYDEVIPTIKRLKQAFPDLTGYLKVKDSGYRGIHLNLKVDGIPCEIQLAPKIAVMAIDYLHSLHEKWRDFDSYKELELLDKKEQEILKSNSQNKKDLLKTLEEERRLLQTKIQEEQEDFKLRSKTYKEIFDTAKLPEYQDDIAKAINELNQHNEKSLPLTNALLIDIQNKSLTTNGKLDKEKIIQVSEELSKNIEPTQSKFVNLVKECLNIQ